jgi:ATP synthase mitochondrial F1 complex assembly factor 2
MHESRASQSLREIQRQTAQPILAFLTSRVWPGAELIPVLDETSIVPKKQPEMTKNIIRGWVMGLPAYELAALERGVLASKSLLVATRLLVEWSEEFRDLQNIDDSKGETEGDVEGKREKRFGIEEAAEACSTEVKWQTGMWGEVEDTHDVDKEDLRRQLGSVVLLVSGNR